MPDFQRSTFADYMYARLPLHNHDEKVDLKMLSEDFFEFDQRNVNGTVDVRKGLFKRVKCYEEPCDAGNQREGYHDSCIPGLPIDLGLDCLAWTTRSSYGSLSCVNRQFNELVKSGYLYRLRRELRIAEPWIYIVCGLVGWEVFDPCRQLWMRLPRIPSDDCFNNTDKESLAVGTELLVFGREATGFVIWKYSLLSPNWARCNRMNLPRCLFGSGSYGQIAIVAGGVDGDGTVLNSAELYNSESGTWEQLPRMHNARKLCSGFFMDGKFYVIGGLSSTHVSLTCGEEYNLQTRTWRRIPNMFPGGIVAAHSPPLVAVVNNQLYAVESATNELKVYDKQNISWNVIGRLPVRADSTNGWGLAFKACGNELIVIGGHQCPEGEFIILNSWEPSSHRGGGENPIDWRIMGIKERSGHFVYNCAVMNC
eukprot:TRINITY_DN1473_c0_g1_i1.p1 TRINITY_DN1473_c0_g1~~TRINITY_DN1473_c0_g1_i1.p1  ORF type:complete len:424 (+),score=47.85 TRINITY_DN1473_c0_g1_i1:592-1863(+)